MTGQGEGRSPGRLIVILGVILVLCAAAIAADQLGAFRAPTVPAQGAAPVTQPAGQSTPSNDFGSLK